MTGFMHRGLAAACASVVALACAEVGVEDDQIYDGPVNACESESECPEGAVCDVELGRCVMAGVAAGKSYFLKVIPGPAQGVPSQVFEVVLDDQGAVAAPLQVRRAVTLNGQAAAGYSIATGIPLHARIIFSESDTLIPGQNARISVYEAAGKSKSFSVDLLPGSYRVTVIPEGNQSASHPVTYIDEVTVTDDGRLLDSVGAELSGIVVQPADRQVSGVVLRGGQPMDGLQVEAINPKTGRLVSTTDVTACAGAVGDSVCGEFEISLAPGTASFALRISRPAEPSYPLTVTAGFDVEPGNEVIDLTGDPELSLQSVGVPVRYRVRVERPEVSSSGDVITVPASGCLVIFESEDVSGGSVSRGVNTNESGLIEAQEGELGVDLYPGAYRVIVIPPPAAGDALSDYAPFVSGGAVEISAETALGDQLYSLPWRPRVEGSVYVAGEGVPQSVLLAEPVAEQPSHVRSNAATTDEVGAFALWTDFGEYLLLAEAPGPSGFAWGRGTLSVTENRQLDMELPIPFVARAVLQSEEVELTDAVVEWYETVFHDHGYPVGRVAVESDGSVTALLPP